MAYYKIPNITVSACWAHIRRKYEEALQGTSKNAADKLTNIQIGKQYCDRLFAIESEINGLAPAERLQKRKEMAEPLLKEFQDWVFHVNDGPKSLLCKAAHYTRKQWPWLTTCLFQMAGWRYPTIVPSAASSRL